MGLLIMEHSEASGAEPFQAVMCGIPFCRGFVSEELDGSQHFSWGRKVREIIAQAPLMLHGAGVSGSC